MKVGIGFDAHPFEEGRPLRLGGIEIPWERGLAGHSDGDVLAHAICDAMLGGAALGDLGQHFPSSDPQWKDVPGPEFLRRTVQIISTVWLRVASVDATVIMEAPSIRPFRVEIRKGIADAIGIRIDDVSVKATTTDKMGFTGRGEGAACMAVAVLESTFGSAGR